MAFPVRACGTAWPQYTAEPTDLPINDLPIAFAARVILERGYDTLIEIGTHSGSRAIALKKLFPAIEVYGLDIQDKFKTPFELCGVNFRLFDLDFIASKTGRVAIISNGVMCCMTRAELRAFLAAANAEIIFHELTPAFAHTGSIQRFPGTWYHDYATEMTNAGFDLLGERHTGQAGQYDMNFHELGYFNVAVKRSDHADA